MEGRVHRRRNGGGGLSRLVDGGYRMLLRRLYPLLCGWERLSGRRSRVALVAVWFRGRLLVVRHSYRPGSSLPGGDCRRGETSLETAVRELAEEVGIAVRPEALVLAAPSARDWSVYEYRPGSEPAVTVDNREIVAAAFRDPTRITDPTGSLARYLQGRRRPDAA